MRLDHVVVDDLEGEAERAGEHGVRFQGRRAPEPVRAPVDMRGGRLWTIPAAAGGLILQMTGRDGGCGTSAAGGARGARSSRCPP